MLALSDAEIIRSQRQTLALEIAEDARLIIRAPIKEPVENIERFVIQKSAWIEKHVNEVRAIHSKRQKRFVETEEFFYLGKTYPLYFVEGAKEPLRFTGRSFEIAAALKQSARQVFIFWYRAKAHQYIAKRVNYFAEEYGFHFSGIRITDAQKRWGSCGVNGRLNFTWRLIMAPPDVVDYVVVHELCHLEEMNHSKRFWSLVESISPQYECQEDWLRENGYLCYL